MATNFRNKQWFKNLSQDRKNDICKKFNIDETTLKKAGRETTDGRIVVDLLRIDHILSTPPFWDECANKLQVVLPEDNMNTTDVFQMISNMEYIYAFMNNDAHFVSYKSNLHNDLLTKFAHNSFKKWYDEMHATDKSDKDHIKFCCYQMYTHCKCLLESDLNLINK
jgi:hypothetical protein